MSTTEEEADNPLEVSISHQVSGMLDEAGELGRQGAPLEDIRALEQRVEQAAEAFVSLKSKSRRIQETRKDRQYHGWGRSETSSSSGQSIESKKSHPSCWDGGKPSHWAEDASCSKPGVGLFRPPPRGESKGGGRGRGQPSSTGNRVGA